MTHRFGWSILLLPPGFTASAQENAQLQATLAALKTKRHTAACQTYKLTIEMSIVRADGKMVKQGRTQELTIEWPSGKFRSDSVTTGGEPFEQLEVFDGERIRTKFRDLDEAGRPKEEWKYGMTTGANQQRIFVADYWPIFFNRGVLKSSSRQAFHAGHFLFDAPDDQFFLHRRATGAGPVVIRSFPERPGDASYYEYTIDPTKDAAVTAFSHFTGGEKALGISVDVQNWKGHWAPVGWQLTRLTRGKPTHTVKVKVHHFSSSELTPPQSFELSAPEGATVGRSDIRAVSKSGEYRIENYEYKIQNGELVQISGPSGSKWFNRTWLWVVVATLFVFALVLIRRRVVRVQGATTSTNST